MSNKINSRFQIKRDTAENWEKNNPILASGELGFDTTTNSMRIGNGTSHWLDLPQWITRESTVDLIMDTYLARGVIDTWVEQASDFFVEKALEPIMNGTYKLNVEIEGLPDEVELKVGATTYNLQVRDKASAWYRSERYPDMDEKIVGEFSFDYKVFNTPGIYIVTIKFTPESTGYEIAYHDIRVVVTE